MSKTKEDVFNELFEIFHDGVKNIDTGEGITPAKALNLTQKTLNIIRAKKVQLGILDVIQANKLKLPEDNVRAAFDGIDAYFSGEDERKNPCTEKSLSEAWVAGFKTAYDNRNLEIV